jgi:cytoskeleton protein RodZ
MGCFGENLKRERELRGVSLREISDATNIAVRFFEAIEQDRLDVLPGGLFPRAFVRQYARHVGLDADRVVADFLESHRREPVEPSPQREGGASRYRQVGLVVAGIAIAGAFALTTSKREPSEAPAVAAPPAQAPPMPADRVYPPPTLREAPDAAPERIVVTLNARQSCWVGAQVDGEPVLNRVLSGGETETLEAQSEIILSVGNAGGIAFTVNNRPGVPLGRSGEVRRNIVISHENLDNLVEEHPVTRASRSS